MPRKYYSGPLRKGERRRRYKPRLKIVDTLDKKLSLTRMIKRVALNQSETKTSGHLTDTYTATAQYFIPNNKTTMLLVNCLGTSTGAEDPGGMESNAQNRVGDQIFAKGMKLNFWLESVSDRQNTSFGVVVFWYNPRILPYTQKIQPSGSPTQPADLAPNFWRGKAGSGEEMCRFLDVIDSNKVKVIKHFKVRNRSANYFENTGSSPPDRQNNPHFLQTYIKLNKKIKYRDDDEKVPQWRDIGVAVYAYNQSTALSTDNVGIVSGSSLLYFKDP